MSLRGFANLVRSTTADQTAGRARVDGQAYFACFTLTTVARAPGVEPFRCIH
jgi:hypothetical protein